MSGNGSNCVGERIDSREYKILLKKNRFDLDGKADPLDKTMKAFWAEVGEVAAAHGVTAAELRKIKKSYRRVWFLDTPAFELRRAGFVFRCREEGNDLEQTLKYRSPSLDDAKTVDVRFKESGKNDCKLEQDYTPVKMAPVPSIKSLYSRSNTVPGKADKPTRVKGLDKLFPKAGIKDLGVAKHDRLIMVSGFRPWEMAAKKKKVLDFGDSMVADAAFNFWFRENGCLLVAEFSFAFDLPRRGVPEEMESRLTGFFEGLQELAGWFDPKAMTKTAYMYGLCGAVQEPQND